MKLRSYRPSDRSSCLEIFESNIPKFFHISERKGFEEFLDNLPGPYFVIEDKTETIVGCGGYAINPSLATADLCWGMVLQTCHGTGLGRLLLVERLARIQSNLEIQLVCLNTCQHTVDFFRHMGFVIEQVIQNGYAPGLDRYEMRFTIQTQVTSHKT